MMTTYRNADTSQRRLEEIKAFWRLSHEELDRSPHTLSYDTRNHSHRLVYDLLAMLEKDL